MLIIKLDTTQHMSTEEKPVASESLTRDHKPTRRPEDWNCSESSSEDEKKGGAEKKNVSKTEPKSEKAQPSKKQYKEKAEDHKDKTEASKPANQEAREDKRQGGEYRFEKQDRKKREDNRQKRREENKQGNRQDIRKGQRDNRQQQRPRPQEDKQARDKRKDDRQRQLQDYDIRFEEEKEPIFANQIIVKDLAVQEYVKQADKLLKDHKFITIKAINFKIADAFLIAEEVAKLVKTLSRINIPGTAAITQVWQPRRKDLSKKTFKKLHPQITIQLSKEGLTKKHIGYQFYKDEAVNEDYNRNQQKRKRNNRGKEGDESRGTNNKETRDNLQGRNDRDERDNWNNRESRDNRDNRDHRNTRDARDNRDNRDNRGNRDNRDNRQRRQNAEDIDRSGREYR